jgi:hypothetical protein
MRALTRTAVDGSIIAATAVLAACSAQTGGGQDGSAASRSRASGDRSRSDTTSTMESTIHERCIALPSTGVRLVGSVRQEARLGPPGYGETPTRDKRDTIFVLRLDSPITVCGDTTLKPKQASIDSVIEVQLTGHVEGIDFRRGGKITVEGTISRAELPWHYLPVVFGVDRVPGVSTKPPRIASKNAGPESRVEDSCAADVTPKPDAVPVFVADRLLEVAR